MPQRVSRKDGHVDQGVNREVGIANQKAGKQDPITTELVGLYAELVAAVEWVTILTLGFTSVDKFSGKKNDEE